MTAVRAAFSTSTAVPRAQRADALPVRRERDFGIGCGRSSGHGAPRGRATTPVPPRFRFG